MAFADDLKKLRAELADAKVAVDDVLTLAGVDRSTWTRWAHKQSPRMDTWLKVTEAAQTLLAERKPSRRKVAA